jgi:hypothetical protein
MSGNKPKAAGGHPAARPHSNTTTPSVDAGPKAVEPKQTTLPVEAQGAGAEAKTDEGAGNASGQEKEPDADPGTHGGEDSGADNTVGFDAAETLGGLQGYVGDMNGGRNLLKDVAVQAKATESSSASSAASVDMDQLAEKARRLAETSSFQGIEKSLKPGDLLRCSSFTYLGSTYDVQAKVLAATEDHGVLLEIPELKTFWPVQPKRVTFGAQSLGVVGTWHHAESDYPPVGKDVPFDERFRISRSNGNGEETQKPKWRPPRKARDGHVWVRAKTALHCHAFDVNGDQCKKAGLGAYLEVSSRIVEGSPAAFEEV